MNRLVPALLATTLGLTVLVGCGDDEERPENSQSSTPAQSETTSGTPSPTALVDTDFGAPAKGKVVRGTGYLFRAPAGWRVTGTRTGDASIDTVVEEPEATDGFRDNLTVTLRAAPAGASLDELEGSVAGQLAGTVPEVDMQPRVVIKGVEALHYGGVASVSGVTYRLEEYVAIDDEGAITVITFSFSPALAAPQRTAISNSVLSTWTWRAAPAGPASATTSPGPSPTS